MGEVGRRSATAVAVVVLLSALVGCATSQAAAPPALYSPVSGRVGEGFAGFRPGDKFSVGDIPVCLDKPGSITITNVEPVAEKNGMAVVAFAVRTIPVGVSPLGEALGDLTAMGLTAAEQQQRVVSNVCGAQARSNVGLQGPPPAGTTEQWVEVDVTVTAPTLPASTRAFRIHYQDAAGDERSTVSNFSLAMCGGTVSDDCQPP